MLADDRRGKMSRFGLVWPFAALALATTALVSTREAPLVSSRPKSPGSYSTPDPPAATGIRSTHAQLWEDPLESASRTEGKLQSADQVRDQLDSILSLGPDRFLIMPVLTQGGPYASDKEDRMRNRYAVLSALATSGFTLSYPQRMSASIVPIITDFGATKRHVVNELQVPIKLFSRDTSGKDDKAVRYVFVLWINESQLGKAPLTALAQILEQLFPDRAKTPKLAIIGPVQSSTLLAMINEDSSWKNPSQKKLDEKSLTALDAEGSRLRSWFPENACCDKPGCPEKESCWNTAINSWLDSAIKLKEKVPNAEEKKTETTTEGKDEENHENRPKTTEYFKRFTNPKLFSPRATVSFEDLGLTTAAKFQNCGLSIVHAIAPDSKLFKVLADELRLRGTLPESEKSREHIVLVTERDTLYGRSIHKTFRNVLKVTAEQNLHVFTYLRGIDGEVPTSTGAPTSSDNLEALARLELPEGTSQRDYLRRLAEEIVRLDAQLRRYGEGRVTAIGVVGSDVFDKLLVLRALRNRFPAARFFTTDLDARYSLPAEYDYTRNLIVVSHFGLGLKRSLRYDVAPFRDSYQTSTFFTTLRALENRQIKLSLLGKAYDNPWGRGGERNLVTRPPDDSPLAPLTEEKGFLEPLVFEIGRTGPYQLTSPTSPVAARIQPASSRSGPWWTWPLLTLLVLSAIALFIGCLSYYLTALKEMVISLRNSSRRVIRRILHLLGRRRTDTQLTQVDTWLCIGLVVSLLLYLSLLFDNSRLEGEPLSVLEGVSIWPSVILLYIAVLWAAYLVFAWLRASQENLESMVNDYVAESAKPVKGLTCPVQLLCERKELERSKKRLQRVFLQSLAFFGLTVVLFLVTGSFPGIPSRGWLAHSIGLLITNFALFALYVISFFVLDVMLHSSRLIVELAQGEYDLTRGELGKLRKGLNDARRREMSELFTIQLIARHTRLPGRMLVFPFLLAMLIASARLSFLDSWDVGLTLMSVISLMLFGVLLGGFMLRKNAEKARRKVLRRVRDELFDALADSRQDSRVSRLRNVISNVENEQRGAFRPLSEDPVIAAAFIPFGGTGTLVLLEQLLNHI